MSAATLFDPDRLVRQFGGSRSALRSLFAGGFGADDDLPQVVAPPSTASNAESKPEPEPEAEESLSRGHYLRGLEEMMARTQRKEMRETLVTVTPAEVQALVEKTAKAKARYLVAALDAGAGDGLPDAAAVKALEAARERHEALSNGLSALLEELRQGSVEVRGVRDETGQTAGDA